MNRKDFTIVICLMTLVLMIYIFSYGQGSSTGLQIQGIGELLVVGTGFLTNDICTVDDLDKIVIKKYFIPGPVFKGNEDNDAHLRMFCGSCVNSLCVETGIIDGKFTETNIELCEPVGDQC
jgi:hypothetical protein